MYLVNLGAEGHSVSLGGLWSRSFLFPWFSSILAWLLNSMYSSTCINLAALWWSSFISAAGYMHKLSAKSPSRRVVIIWCMATFGFSPWMLRATLPNLSMNIRRDSPLSCLMFTNATDVMWWGLLVIKCAPNMATKVSKESIDWGGSQVNQLSAAPFREVGKTLQYMLPSGLMYSSESVDWVTYRSNTVFFQLGGNSVAIISSVKGFFLDELAIVLCDASSLRSSCRVPSLRPSCRVPSLRPFCREPSSSVGFSPWIHSRSALSTRCLSHSFSSWNPFNLPTWCSRSSSHIFLIISSSFRISTNAATRSPPWWFCWLP